MESLWEHIKATGHKACTCSGYHFPHRPNSPCCDVNRMATYHRALRAGATQEELEDLLLDIVIFGSSGKKASFDEPPF